MTGQPLEYRTATVTGMSYPKRTVDLIVMPYEKEAVVEYRGRLVREVVSRGAFDGLQMRANRVKLNRDHDVTRLCGHAVAFHPSRDEGLVAEVYVTRSELGNETLELANDGDLAASAGFRPKTNKDTGRLEEEWPEKNLRRLNKIWLGHIALTPDPAYEDAQVLAVRSDKLLVASEGIVVATPNRDRARALILNDVYSQICR